MKRFKLIISPFAEIDLELAKEWDELQKENLGSEFIEEVDNVLIQVNVNPFQYPKTQKTIHKAVVKRFPFSVFFIVQNQVIIVIAVFHNSRNPIIWKNRIK